MTDPAPRYQCLACHRGVLNRNFPRCLYCGVDLPEEVLLPEAERRRANALPVTLAAMPERQQSEDNSTVVDKVVDAIDLTELVVDSMDLITGLFD